MNLNIRFFDEIINDSIGCLNMEVINLKNNKDFENFELNVIKNINDLKEQIKSINKSWNENNLSIYLQVERQAFDDFIFKKKQELEEKKNPIYKYKNISLLNNLLFNNDTYANVEKNNKNNSYYLRKNFLRTLNNKKNQKYTQNRESIKLNLIPTSDILPKLVIKIRENNVYKSIDNEILNEYKDILINWIKKEYKMLEVLSLMDIQAQSSRKTLLALGYTEKQVQDLNKSFGSKRIMIDESWLLFKTPLSIMKSNAMRSPVLPIVQEMDMADKVKSSISQIREMILKNKLIESKKVESNVKKQKI